MRFLRRLAVPVIGLAVIAGAGLGWKVLANAEDRGFLEAESARLADIARNERDAANLARRQHALAVATGSKMQERIAAAEREAEAAKVALRTQEKAAGACRPGCLVPMPTGAR